MKKLTLILLVFLSAACKKDSTSTTITKPDTLSIKLTNIALNSAHTISINANNANVFKVTNITGVTSYQVIVNAGDYISCDWSFTSGANQGSGAITIYCKGPIQYGGSGYAGSGGFKAP